jgi:hypothetical protein
VTQADSAGRRVSRRLASTAQALGQGLRGLANAPQKIACCTGLDRRMRHRLPDFLCIGAQKAGTTWLMNNLARHPEIFLPANIKHFDIHYFDRHFHQPLGWYAEFFSAAGERYKGDSTPAYGLLPDWKIGVVRRLMPDVRILFMMRNPIDRAWSHALMNFVTDQGRKFESISDDEFIAHFHLPRSRQRGDYMAIINRWERAFPLEQIAFGFFDEISAQPRRLVSRMLEHIGIRTEPDWSSLKLDEVVNRGAGQALPVHLRRTLVTLYAEPIERLYERFGAPVAGWRCGQSV